MTFLFSLNIFEIALSKGQKAKFKESIVKGQLKGSKIYQRPNFIMSKGQKVKGSGVKGQGSRVNGQWSKVKGQGSSVKGQRVRDQRVNRSI
jgi:hypothetical protein